MRKLGLNEIREEYLDFFESKSTYPDALRRGC